MSLLNINYSFITLYTELHWNVVCTHQFALDYNKLTVIWNQNYFYILHIMFLFFPFTITPFDLLNLISVGHTDSISYINRYAFYLTKAKRYDLDFSLKLRNIYSISHRPGTLFPLSPSTQNCLFTRKMEVTCLEEFCIIWSYLWAQPLVVWMLGE